MWDVIKEGIYQIFNFFYLLVGDWGLAIIIFTIIFRLCLTPLVHKQSKSSYAMRKMQPEMNRIKEMYADDKQRQSQEMQKVYQETKFNPLTGCIPMLIQMPIFFALFQVLREIDQYVPDTSVLRFYDILPDLTASPSYMVENFGFVSAIPYIIILIIFAGATFVPMLIMQPAGGMGNSKKQTYLTAGIMSIMMLWFGWGSPGGVLLYWGTSSLLGIFQQQLSMKLMERKDAIEEAKKPVELKPVQVNVVRKEKKKRPTKKK
ncbi:MAG: YidC/Oxa1 family membrane protein insertase [Enterococcus sp.]|nr:YidC/Oxa1 family membrane protein insertase [Enterococcus sp.]